MLRSQSLLLRELKPSATKSAISSPKDLDIHNRYGVRRLPVRNKARLELREINGELMPSLLSPSVSHTFAGEGRVHGLRVEGDFKQSNGGEGRHIMEMKIQCGQILHFCHLLKEALEHPGSDDSIPQIGEKNHHQTQ
ncbi:hypothetical protein L1987_43509 [Smallanthus sonchifolius]|uniref:Uncharacterized protein n=1 Tax=Smallanthus sonchifolius TaxID=185202 RepID=A0ACB9GLR0_9ASTR|nr:hypothetical protein L1987_43509 [Smallanthus sonchifolius]